MAAKVTACMTDIACEDSGHTMVPCAPNMCITPAAPSPLPMPYVLTSSSSSLDPGTSKVCVGGKKTMNLKCKLKKVDGNQPGSQKDITTAQTTGHAWCVTGAFTVLFEGAPICITGSTGFANSV
ncbi:MAG: DUF4150 domain-containing protein [Deltaproteobacteria bacterium]|nr:DUF4150 domain-containing protein [Deltaproteobacteria bacterium]